MDRDMGTTFLDGLLLGGGSCSLRASLITSFSRTLGIHFVAGNGNNSFTSMNFEEQEMMVVSSTTQMSFDLNIFCSENRTEDLVGPCFNVSNDDVYKRNQTKKQTKQAKK
jgi:hypothetical protein